MSVAQLLLNRGANVNFTPKVSLSYRQLYHLIRLWHISYDILTCHMVHN